VKKGMKIIFTVDLHGHEGLYDQLFDLSLKEEAGAILIGGDMLPKESDFLNLFEVQKGFIRRFLKSFLKKISRERPGMEIYAMLGNDDWAGNLPFIEELQSQRLLRLLHQRKYALSEDFEIIGYENVPPTPFSIKDGERIDVPGVPIEPQTYSAFASSPSGIKQINAFDYFQANPTMEDDLADLPVPGSYQKAIYVFHAPPFQTQLDRLYDGRPIGSRAIRGFIERHQPLLTLHGHIHESPYQSGKYLDKIGETLCINPGQSDHKLHAVIFDLDRVEETIRHTIFD
jgi:uncharacterized protein